MERLSGLAISNVPGPQIPLYCSGARVVATYPMGPILEGAGRNITVLSNMSNVDFGAIACLEMVPRIFDLATGFSDAVAELRTAADATPARDAPAARATSAASTPASVGAG